MFVVVEMIDTVRIPPWNFHRQLNDTIAEELNKKLANKVSPVYHQNNASLIQSAHTGPTVWTWSFQSALYLWLLQSTETGDSFYIFTVLMITLSFFAK